VGDPVQPVPQQLSPAQAGSLAHKDQKRRLKCVVHVVGIVEQLAADGKDHRSIPHHESFESGFIAAGQETFQQLNFSESSDRPAASEETMELPRDESDPPARHVPFLLDACAFLESTALTPRPRYNFFQIDGRIGLSRAIRPVRSGR
jgi:hypothetical protein